MRTEGVDTADGLCCGLETLGGRAGVTEVLRGRTKADCRRAAEEVTEGEGEEIDLGDVVVDDDDVVVDGGGGGGGGLREESDGVDDVDGNLEEGEESEGLEEDVGVDRGGLTRSCGREGVLTVGWGEGAGDLGGAEGLREEAEEERSKGLLVANRAAVMGGEGRSETPGEGLALGESNGLLTEGRGRRDEEDEEDEGEGEGEEKVEAEEEEGVEDEERDGERDGLRAAAEAEGEGAEDRSNGLVVANRAAVMAGCCEGRGEFLAEGREERVWRRVSEADEEDEAAFGVVVVGGDTLGTDEREVIGVAGVRRRGADWRGADGDGEGGRAGERMAYSRGGGAWRGAEAAMDGEVEGEGVRGGEGGRGSSLPSSSS